MPARRLDQSFAMVQFADYEGVEVFVQNQPVGRTDSKGRVPLDNLLPYQTNEVSVDPAKVPMDATLDKASMTVTPAYRSGAVVKFPVTRANAVTLRLVQPNGRPVPAGAEVTIGEGCSPVGLKGSVFLTGISQRVPASASWVGGHCTFEVSRPAGKDPQPDLGELSCQPSAVKETRS